MPTVALFCEGVSEVKILTHIITKYLGDEVSINALQPELVINLGVERQNTFGGWLEVLRHCNDEDVKRALITNDYLVIQIDTDTCSRVNYDVSEYDDNGRRISDEVLYVRVVSRALRDLSPEILAEFRDRILFAVCIDEIECWLLPIYYEREHSPKCYATHNCMFHLNQKLSREGLGIPATDKNCPLAIKTYQKILKNLKQKDIPRVSAYNYGFKMFVAQMDCIKTAIVTPEE